MEQLYEIRGLLINYYKKYETIINAIVKFIILYFIFSKINKALGYAHFLNKTSVNFVLSFISIMLSPQWILLLVIFLISTHLFFVSLEAAIILMVMMLIVFLLYVRMFPKMSYIILAVPICYYFKIPLAVPLFVALFIGLPTIVPVSIGVVAWNFMKYMPIILEAKSESVMNMPKALSNMYLIIIQSLAQDKEMIVTIIVFSAVIIITYVINRLSIDYASYIAVVGGFLINIVGFVMGILIMGLKMGATGLILQSSLAIIVICIIEFFSIALNYVRAEKVQFEDDEYYYYVKAIPKIIVEKPKRNIKKITNSRKY